MTAYASRVRDVRPELVEPDLRRGVAGRAPVAARRERAAGADLRRVGDRGPLELREAEEAVQEDLQPALALADRVLVAALGRDQIGPWTALAVGPRVLGEERDLARPVTEAQQVEQVEVLQLVGPDLALAVAGRLVALAGDQLG